MSPADFDKFLQWVSILALILGMANLLRIRRRGSRAAALALASFLFAVDVQLYRRNAPVSIIVGVGVIIFASLAADFAMKSSTNHPTKDGPA